MDYKLKYKAIPKNKRGLVMAGINKTDVSRWYNEGHVSPEKKAIIERNVYKVWVEETQAGKLGIIFGRTKLVVENDQEFDLISYDKLMDFKLTQTTNSKAGPHAIYDLMQNAKDCIQTLYQENPYQTKQLIVKYLIHVQANEH